MGARKFSPKMNFYFPRQRLILALKLDCFKPKIKITEQTKYLEAGANDNATNIYLKTLTF